MSEIGTGSKIAMILGIITFLIATYFGILITQLLLSAPKAGSFAGALGNAFALAFFLVFWFIAIVLTLLFLLLGKAWRQSPVFTGITTLLSLVNLYLVPIQVFLFNYNTLDLTNMKAIQGYTIITLPILLILFLEILAIRKILTERE